MEKIKLDLVKFQSHYRVVANVDDKTFSYKTTDKSLAEDVLNVVKKMVNAADDTGDTPTFVGPGKTADGDYIVLVGIEGEEFYLHVETQRDAYELVVFLSKFFGTREDKE